MDETKIEKPSFNQVVNLENAKTSKRKAAQESAENAINDKLKNVLTSLTKDFGKNSLFKLGDRLTEEMPHLPFGILPLDFALGIGGMPRGRIAEVFGAESSGKTSLCLKLVASVQKNGGVAAYVDAEHALDPSWAKFLGVNVEQLLTAQPDSGEEALAITEKLAETNNVDLIIVDSVAALVPRAELEGEMGDAFMGLQARMMGQAMRKMTAKIAKSDTCVVFINQVRESMSQYTPVVTSGGRALKFFSSVRIEVKRIEQIKKGDVIIGNRMRAKMVKNKVAPPFRQADFDLFFAKGFDNDGSIFDLGVQYKIIDKAGSWFAYKENRLGQGKENALKNMAPYFSEIEAQVLTCLKNTKDLNFGAQEDTSPTFEEDVVPNAIPKVIDAEPPKE